jgi:hypothetical protein
VRLADPSDCPWVRRGGRFDKEVASPADGIPALNASCIPNAALKSSSLGVLRSMVLLQGSFSHVLGDGSGVSSKGSGTLGIVMVSIASFGRTGRLRLLFWPKKNDRVPKLWFVICVGTYVRGAPTGVSPVFIVCDDQG